MELKLFNLVSRGEIPVPALPEEDWDLVAAGGRFVLLGRRGGAAAALRVREDGESCEAALLSQVPAGLDGIAVSRTGEEIFALWTASGELVILSPGGIERASFSNGIRTVVLGSAQAVLDGDGAVHYRRHSGAWTGGWRLAELESAEEIVSGPYRLCARLSGGRIEILETGRDPTGGLSERGPGTGSAIADGYCGLYTLRNGKLCRNGRICVTGCDAAELGCAVSAELEYAVCRRPDGTFLTALVTGTYTPSSLPFDGAPAVRAWDAGDRILACLL